MIAVLDDLLSPAETTALAGAAAALDFVSGDSTAGRIARRVKSNLQARPGAATEAVLEKARRALLAHPDFQAMAIPKAFASMLVSRTEDGGHYGDHVDNALMGGQRSDLSFTLFLSDPDSYDGGELTMVDTIEDRQFKLGPGAAIVYPSNTLHRVEPVTRGSRLVVVGWVTSRVRDPGQREILFDLANALAGAEAAGDKAQIALLMKTRSNLLRMWAD